MTADAVQQALTNIRQRDLPSRAGRALSTVFDSGIAEVDQLGRDVFASFASTDGQDIEAYPSWVRMEQDLISLAGGLLDAPDGGVGTFTSGGSESTLLAVQAARDSRPEVARPAMVLPTSAQPAFHQAARSLRVEPVFVDVDQQTCRADAAAMTDAITPSTVLVVASAPSHAHGVIDPITEIAAAAQARGVRCHVDASLGGWLLPYFRRVDPYLPAFAFDVAGVTSISVDLDTYAYTPKGASLLLHRTAELRRPQFFSSAAGPAYPTVSSTTQGARSGGPLAAAWAVTRFVGDHGYARLARTVRSGVQTLVNGLAEVEHVRVLTEPTAGVVAIATDGRCDVFTVCDELASRGWYARPQLSFGTFPATLHLVVSAATVPRIPEFLDAFKASVKTATGAGPVKLSSDLVTAIRTVDLRTVADGAFDELLRSVGIDTRGALVLPDRMAPVHAMLDVATAPVRQALAIELLDRQLRPRR